MVLRKDIATAFDSEETSVEDIRELLAAEAKDQGWTLEYAFNWARSADPARNYVQADIKLLASLLDLCSAAA